MNRIYTIGHSTHTLDHFMELLSMHQINFILDVRSVPYSKYCPQYNREAIAAELKGRNINYAFMGKYFGARQTDLNLYTADGYVDFEAVRESKVFNIGLENVEKGMSHYNIALMWAEKKPMDCHRAILVGHAFWLKGHDVCHILSDGKFQTQEDINKDVLHMYFPNNSISGDEKDCYLTEAYKLHNKKVGYYINKGKSRRK